MVWRDCIPWYEELPLQLEERLDHAGLCVDQGADGGGVAEVESQAGADHLAVGHHHWALGLYWNELISIEIAHE